MTRDELIDLIKKINDIHVVLLGVPETEDRGLCGELKDVKEIVVKANGRSKGNTMAIKGIYATTAVIITVLLHLMGVY